MGRGRVEGRGCDQGSPFVRSGGGKNSQLLWIRRPHPHRGELLCVPPHGRGRHYERVVGGVQPQRDRQPLLAHPLKPLRDRAWRVAERGGRQIGRGCGSGKGKGSKQNSDSGRKGWMGHREAAGRCSRPPMSRQPSSPPLHSMLRSILSITAYMRSACLVTTLPPPPEPTSVQDPIQQRAVVDLPLHVAASEGGQHSQVRLSHQNPGLVQSLQARWSGRSAASEGLEETQWASNLSGTLSV
jgi:hypothetical protein